MPQFCTAGMERKSKQLVEEHFQDLEEEEEEEEAEEDLEAGSGSGEEGSAGSEDDLDHDDDDLDHQVSLAFVVAVYLAEGSIGGGERVIGLYNLSPDVRMLIVRVLNVEMLNVRMVWHVIWQPIFCSIKPSASTAM